ncbi:MAG: RadC family protein [Anaerorhabdus sp.]
MIIRDLPECERPREKAKKYGVGVLSNAELIAILIRHGFSGHSSIDVALEILKKSKGISGLSKLTINDLKCVNGIKDVKATEILACFELAKRISFEQGLNKDVVKNPNDLINWLRKKIGNETQENFLAVYLNVRNHILGYRTLFKGTVDKSIVHPREVFKEALLLSSSKVMMVHNHPSGDLTPSNADIDLTDQMIDAAKLMGMEIIDHIIVSNEGYFSFKANGLI